MSVSQPALSAPATTAPKPAILWTGRVLSALPVLGLLMSGAMKISLAPEVVEGFTKMGFPESVIRPIGIVEVLCAILFAVPQTAVLGAILATGYLGGAVCTHVRGGEAFTAPLLMGIMVWVGIGLRDARLRALLPLRSL